jgi:peroxiredoxin
MPGFEADYEKYRDQILTVAVNTGFNDSEEAVRDYRRQHGLHMPIAIDDGTLGTALNLRVTPQHVVIGRNGRILYVGHAADDRLRQALADAIREPAATAPLAPSGGTPETAATASALDTFAGVPLTGAIADGKPRVLVFFAPWCESYFATSRPAYAANCKRMREEVNALASAGGVHWVGISSGLWSSPKDLEDYRSSKAMSVPLYLDATGRLFRSFDVRDVPTAIVLDRRGRIVRRVGPSDGNLAAAIRVAEARS